MQRYDLVGDYDLSIAPINDGAYVLYTDAMAAIVAEREACANICDTHTAEDVLVGVGIAKSCAAMIRMRSNGG